MVRCDKSPLKHEALSPSKEDSADWWTTGGMVYYSFPGATQTIAVIMYGQEIEAMKVALEEANIGQTCSSLLHDNSYLHVFNIPM